MTLPAAAPYIDETAVETDRWDHRSLQNADKTKGKSITENGDNKETEARIVP